MSISSVGGIVTRAALLSCVALSVTACANEPVGSRGFAPMMMVGGAKAEAPAVAAAPEPTDPFHELSKKSLAAKVLTSRALENVTGMAIDPARLSEHD